MIHFEVQVKQVWSRKRIPKFNVTCHWRILWNYKIRTTCFVSQRISDAIEFIPLTLSSKTFGEILDTLRLKIYTQYCREAFLMENVIQLKIRSNTKHGVSNRRFHNKGKAIMHPDKIMKQIINPTMTLSFSHWITVVV